MYTPTKLTANKAILELARKHNIKVIATNDVHFVNAEDAEAHDRLIALVRVKIWMTRTVCATPNRNG